MRHLAQKLHRVRLRLDRIGVGVVDPADHLDGARLHLEGLPLRRRRHDLPGRLDRATGRELQHLTLVIGQGVRRHHLQRVERRAVRKVHEGNAGPRVPPGAHPAFDRDRGVVVSLACQKLAHAEICLVHEPRVAPPRGLVQRLPEPWAARAPARAYRRRVNTKPVTISRMPPTMSTVIAPPKIRVDSRNPQIGVRVSTWQATAGGITANTLFHRK